MQGMQATNAGNVPHISVESFRISGNTIVLTYQGIPENVQEDSEKYLRSLRGSFEKILGFLSLGLKSCSFV